ncbi:LCP family protein [Alteribacillus sp. JSM 102045]|uniref:LCP family glycopolymer transferase n=1 Tax=Alteribacillus sp. JSM 102045 TaxID=1562101 RepID=UPI0035BF8FF7
MKKLLIIIGGMIGFLVLAVGGYAYYLYSSISDTASTMHENIVRESNHREAAASPEKDDPISFLLLGIDNEDTESGRSDTMIVLTVNPNKESIKMVSIPRDTRTEIIGRGREDKINHAYAFGGAQMAIDTVENFLNIPIDYIVSINLDGFEDIVDTVDGVTVNNNLAFEHKGFDFPEGELHLSGEEALAYVRMRKEDPEGDLGRNERQRDVVDAIIHEGANLSSIIKAGDFLSILGENVRTNMTFDEMKDFQDDYRSSRHNIETLEMSGDGTTIDGIYYMNIHEEVRNHVSETLRKHLELD